MTIIPSSPPSSAAANREPSCLWAEDAFRSTIGQAATSMLAELARCKPVSAPFRHVVADGLFDPAVLRQVATAFPPPDSPLWFRYDSPLEKKFCCNRMEKLSPLLAAFIHRLNAADVAAVVGEVFNIDDLVVDPSLHGGGLHMVERGGKLDIHLDFSDHPKLPLSRRVNLLLYLNEDWDDAWGGQLELWDDRMTQCVVRIAPRFNRLVLFEVREAYHGHPEPLRVPPGQCRRSIALYFLTPRHTVKAKHPRARFVARPQDALDPNLDALRRQRATIQPTDLRVTYSFL